MTDKPYKQIVILSGKGGTGKTTFSAALSSLVNNKLIIDCDVDAANLYIILNPRIINIFEFSGGKKAFIEREKCNRCGLCETICRFDAINDFIVDNISCEGCGFCFRVCPSNVILFNPIISGNYYECRLNDNSAFYYARLYPGEGNSGKLVSEIKKEALKKKSLETEWIIVDGPPGIGCPVNASIVGANYVVIVTEPTLSGIHDLKRLVELIIALKVKAGIVINKYNLNPSIALQISKYAEDKSVPIIGQIPFDDKFVKALMNKNNIVDVDESIRKLILSIWQNVKQQVE